MSLLENIIGNNVITKKKHSALIKAVLITLLLSIPVLFIYGDIRSYSFVDYDDPLYILNNQNISQGFSLRSISWAFTTFHAANWHPFTWLSHMLDIEFYGLNPGGHHWTNVQIHIANTLLLFLILFRMTKALWRSIFVALLFAVHPLHVESVAWISERKDVLSTFFGLLTILFYYHYTKRSNLGMYFLVFLNLSLGLMAKPMLVTWPFVLLLLDYWPLRRFSINKNGKGSLTISPRIIKKLILEKIPLTIPVIISCILTVQAQKGAGVISSLDAISLNARVANAAVSYIQYIVKTIWPKNLIVLYPYSELPLLSWHVIGVVVFLLVVTGAALLLIRKQPYLFIGWMWYIGTLVPVIGIVQVGSQAIADRYTYIPLIGIFIIATWGMHSIFSAIRERTYILGMLAFFVLTAFSYQATIQTTYWKDTRSLFQHALDVSPDNWVAHNNLGALFLKSGNIEEAIPYFKTVLSLKPGNLETTLNMAEAFFSIGKTDAAKEYYLKVFNIERDNTKHEELQRAAALGLAGVLNSEEKFDEANAINKELIGRNPADFKSHHGLAYNYSLLNKYIEAEKHYKIALDIKPDYADAHYNLAQLYLRNGNHKKAMGHMAQALSIIDQMKTEDINPGYAKVFYTYGKIILEQDKVEEAKVFFKKALEIDPNDNKSIGYLQNLNEKHPNTK